MRLRNDTLWKAILEDIFEDFLRFFYPNADEIFDFSKGFEFMDKEFNDMILKPEKERNRHVDKLVKVWLKNGEEHYILIHFEVQGKPDKKFDERMFRYFYLIRHKFGCKVSAWAIFTDKNRKFKPTEFRESTLGTHLVYQFNTNKIIEQDEKLLSQSDNPFAFIVLVVLLALKKGKVIEENLVDLKLELFKELLKNRFPKEKIRSLRTFLDGTVQFNEENTRIFEQKKELITNKSSPMGLYELALKETEKRGEKRGEKRERERHEKMLEEYILSLRTEDNFSIEKIAKTLKLSPERVQEILTKLKIQ